MEGKQLWGQGRGTFRGHHLAEGEVKGGRGSRAGEQDGCEKMLEVGRAGFQMSRISKAAGASGPSLLLPPLPGMPAPSLPPGGFGISCPCCPPAPTSTGTLGIHLFICLSFGSLSQRGRSMRAGTWLILSTVVPTAPGQGGPQYTSTDRNKLLKRMKWVDGWKDRSDWTRVLCSDVGESTAKLRPTKAGCLSPPASVCVLDGPASSTRSRGRSEHRTVILI